MGTNAATERPNPHRHNAVRTFFRWLLAIGFILAGANHFRSPELYLAMIPPMLPWPTGINFLSGLAEIAGGIGILIPSTRRLAGICLVVLLIAIFPANIYVAMRGHMEGVNVSPLGLWLRLPFQLVFIGWVWWVAIRREPFESAWETPFG